MIDRFILTLDVNADAQLAAFPVRVPFCEAQVLDGLVAGMGYADIQGWIIVFNVGRGTQLVAANAGHSPEVLPKNYGEALDSEKRTLATLIETSFYPTEKAPDNKNDMVATILEAMSKAPNISEQILKTLLLHASNGTMGADSRV